MFAWEFPFFIIVTMVIALVVARMIMAWARLKKPTPNFTCNVCGAESDSADARTWRYCPFCGSRRTS